MKNIHDDYTSSQWQAIIDIECAHWAKRRTGKLRMRQALKRGLRRIGNPDEAARLRCIGI